MVHKISHNHGMYGDIKLFAGTAIPEVARGISEYLNIPLSGRDIIEYANENLWVRLHNSVRGQDVYLIQNTSRPVHRNLMELLITLQTLRLDSAGRVTAVIPHLSYTRSDKKDSHAGRLSPAPAAAARTCCRFAPAASMIRRRSTRR